MSADTPLGVYEERNAVVVAFAWAASALGWTVGVLRDPAEPDWPVVVIDTPDGQAAWHVTRGDVPRWMGPYPGVWDGHTTEEKYQRVRFLLARTPGRQP